MAGNEKTTPKIFKFGDNEYTVSDYNSAYDKYVSDFIDFAKQKGQFDDTNLKLLQEALLTKRDQINNGDELNHLGGHNDDTVHNVSIPTYERRGLRKKEKYVDQDITEWVNYFNRSIIGKMNKYNSESKKNPKDWDINKYGLLTAFNTRSAESYFNDYDKGSGDGTTPRGFTQRNSELLSGLQRYNNILKDYNFDYTKNDDWRDNDYQTILKDLENELSNPNPNQQKIAELLRNAGFTDDYITAFTSDQHKWNESLTQTASAYKAEQDAKAKQQVEEQAKKEQEALNAKNKQIRDAIQQQWTTNMNQYYLPHEFSNTYTFPILTTEKYDTWLNDKYITNVHGGDEKTAIATLAKIYEDINKNMFKSNYWKSFNQYWFHHKMNSDNPLNTINHEGVTYYTFPMPDTAYHYTIGFDPNTGKSIKYYYLNGTDQERQQVFKKWLEKNIKALSNNTKFSETDIKNAFSNYFPHTDIVTGVFKDGGILFAQQGSELNAINNYINKQKQKTEAEYQRQADEAGISVEALKSKKRRVFGDEKFYDDNVGFTEEDWWRMTNMGINLGSMFLTPTAGTVAGAASSLSDFAADLKYGDSTWDAVKNLGLNLGMDAIGFIPGIGDSLGTMNKVRRSLLRIAPKIITYLTTIPTLLNTPQIIDSFKKIIDDRDLTREDLQNIYQGINLIVAGGRGVKNTKASIAMQNAARKSKDGVQVEALDDYGNKVLLQFKGDIAEKIKSVKKDPNKIQEIINDHEGYQGYTVSKTSGNLNILKKQTDEFGTRRPFISYEEGQAKVTRLTDLDKLKEIYADNYGILHKRTNDSESFKGIHYLAMPKRNTEDLSQVETREQFLKRAQEEEGDNIKYLYDDIKELHDKLKENKVSTVNIDELRKKEKTLREKKKKLFRRYDESPYEESQLDEIKAEIENLKQSKKILTDDMWDPSNYHRVDELSSELNKIEKDLHNANRMLHYKKKLYDSRQNIRQEYENVKDLWANVYNNVYEYDELNDNLNDLITRLNDSSKTVTFNGKEYQIQPKLNGISSIEQLREMFKLQQGGKIDKEKLNKFLNYAKR